jgi:hypothetical protein
MEGRQMGRFLLKMNGYSVFGSGRRVTKFKLRTRELEFLSV